MNFVALFHFDEMNLNTTNNSTQINYAIISVDSTIYIASSINLIFNIVLFSVMLYRKISKKKSESTNTTFTRLFIMMQLSSLFVNFAFCFNIFHGFFRVKEGLVCLIQAILIQMSCWCLFSYVLMIPIFIILTFAINFNNQKKFLRVLIEVLVHFFIICLVIGLTIIPFFFHAYEEEKGKDRLWCWFDEFWNQMGFYYFPLWTLILLDIFSYFIIYCYLKYKLKLLQSLNTSSSFIKLFLYPSAFAVVWFLPTVNRILGFFGISFFPIKVAHTFIVQLFGAFNVVIFLINPSIFNKCFNFKLLRPSAKESMLQISLQKGLIDSDAIINQVFGDIEDEVEWIDGINVSSDSSDEEHSKETVTTKKKEESPKEEENIQNKISSAEDEIKYTKM